MLEEISRHMHNHIRNRTLDLAALAPRGSTMDEFAAKGQGAGEANECIHEARASKGMHPDELGDSLRRTR